MLYRSSHIAPCGINCATCLAFLRTKNRCDGCCSEDASKRHYCSVCRIKNCERLKQTATKLCVECSGFPCQRLKQLDKRYRLRYNVSLISNLLLIKDKGLEQYLKEEEIRWTCQNCSSSLCVHRSTCTACGQPVMKESSVIKAKS